MIVVVSSSVSFSEEAALSEWWRSSKGAWVGEFLAYSERQRLKSDTSMTSRCNSQLYLPRIKTPLTRLCHGQRQNGASCLRMTWKFELRRKSGRLKREREGLLVSCRCLANRQGYEVLFS